ncbi:MAG: hypothetical protein J6P83_07530 [Bacteroidales bacterium]|nr:hypothetical protein [Bacteroidales bacterium]
MKGFSKLSSYIVGLVFLLSSFAKASDSGYFASVLLQYGSPYMQFLAPFIILTEAFLGLLLLFFPKTRLFSVFSLIFLFVVTVGYAYGIVFKGIEDCGCFGHLKFLSSSPIIVFARNAVLVVLLLISIKHNSNSSIENYKTWFIISIVVIIISFFAGFSYNITPIKKKSLPQLVDSGLQNFIETSPDSTYFVFLFSYKCPRCLNSIANLNTYEEDGIADKVYGLSTVSGGDEKFVETFNKNFSPNFTIINCSKELYKVTSDFPTSYLIKNNQIVMMMKGELPCSYVLKSSLDKKK